MTLSDRQRRFAEHLVSGLSAAEAARRAGYSASWADRKASAAVGKGPVSAYLAELRAQVAGESIATATERAEFWTATMRDTRAGWRWRLKASELLARAGGDFAGEQARYPIDVRELSVAQLEYLAGGGDPRRVYADVGTPPGTERFRGGGA